MSDDLDPVLHNRAAWDAMVGENEWTKPVSDRGDRAGTARRLVSGVDRLPAGRSDLVPAGPDRRRRACVWRRVVANRDPTLAGRRCDVPVSAIRLLLEQDEFLNPDDLPTSSTTCASHSPR